jgi:YegS/Rv2252/BmrU family lipid kinase
MKYKIILNPISGRGSGGQHIPAIESCMKKAGLEFDLVRTARPLHAVELASQAAADGYDVVVAAGGDGTANEVLNGLMQARTKGIKNVAMGVLCVGRGNDFAFGMNVPHDLATGCLILALNHWKRFDVGLVKGGLFPEGRYFGNGVGIGFDAVVGFVALKMKRLTGFLSYVVAALKTIFLYFHAPRVRIETDQGTQEMPALMVSVMNGRRMGGGFMMAPDALPDDGKFDCCIAREVSRLRIFGLMFKFMKGTQTTHQAIQMIRTRKITVTALEGVLPAHADGETLCTEGSALSMEILPGEMEIVCAARGPSQKK